MCMEDIRLGRKVKIAAYAVPVTAAANVQLLPQNDSRVFVIISSPGGQVMVQVGDLVNQQSTGVSVGPTTPSLYLDVKTHGEAVMTRITATAVVGPFTVAVIEGFLEDR